MGEAVQSANASRLRVESCTAAMQGRTIEPHACEARADAECVAWAVRFGLAEGAVAAARVARIRSGSCAAHTYADGSEARVLLGAKLITWLFLFDDAYGEGGRSRDLRGLMGTLASYETTWRSGRPPHDATPFHRALLDLRDEAIALGADDGWLLRFGDSLARYFDGCQLEFTHRQAGTVPSVADYRRLRAWSIGTYPVFDLIDLDGAPRLALEDAHHPALVRLRERAALLCAWVNDVYSYEKERDSADPLNLVAVLRTDYGLSETDAYLAAAEVFNADLETFEAEVDQLGSELRGPAVVAFVDGLRQWIHGNFTWTALCRRYGSRAQKPS